MRNGFTLNVFHFWCQVNNEVRLSSDLSEGEIKATKNRRGRVQMCLLEEFGVHFDEVSTDNRVKVKRITLPWCNTDCHLKWGQIIDVKKINSISAKTSTTPHGMKYSFSPSGSVVPYLFYCLLASCSPTACFLGVECRVRKRVLMLWQHCSVTVKLSVCY